MFTEIQHKFFKTKLLQSSYFLAQLAVLIIQVLKSCVC